MNLQWFVHIFFEFWSYWVVKSLMTVNNLWKPLVLFICLFKVDFSKASHTFYLSHMWVKHKSVWKRMLISLCFSNILAHFPNGGIYFISVVFYLHAKKRIIAVLWIHILKNSSMQWSVYSQSMLLSLGLISEVLLAQLVMRREF